MQRVHRVVAALFAVLLVATSAAACRGNGDGSDTGGKKATQGNFVVGRVAQLNVCGTWKCLMNRAQNIADVIGGNRPEVIGLEEACNSEVEHAADILRNQYHLNYHIVKGPTGTSNSAMRCWESESFGNYILTAAQPTDTGHANYTVDSSEKRGYVWATTTLNGEPTRIVATQLPQAAQEAARTVAVKQLVKAFEPASNDPVPTFVIGDFNAQEFDPELTPMWRSWFDADPNCGPDRSDPDEKNCKGTQLGFNGSGGTNKKFDYIWLDRRAVTTPPGLTVQAAYTDHSLVYADLSSGGAPIVEKECLNSNVTEPCLHTDTLSGDVSVQAPGHGLYVAPSRMYVGSNLAIKDIQWKSWGRPTARGEGWTASTNCNPNCAEGKPIRIRVEVEASTMKPYNGLRIYTCARARKAGKSWDSLGISGKVCVKVG